MDYKEMILEDIDALIDKLDYLKKFIENNLKEEDEIKFIGKINVIHTDIQILSNKLNYKK